MTPKKHSYNIGDGATIAIGSDCYPATVVHVTPTRIVVQRDNYRNTNGENFQSGRPEFSYTPNENAELDAFSVRKNGRVLGVGCDSMRLSPGRTFYQDPHF